MFNHGTFISHSGKQLSFKIECDDLTDNDLETLAKLVSKRLQFGRIKSVPTGGDRFAAALQKYCTKGPTLIVDDVFTTGRSMEKARESPYDLGVVIFARSKCPCWITPIFTLNYEAVLEN